MTSRVEARALEHQRFRTDVEGLRAVAVLLVMLYHAGLALPKGGYIGVDVFFVVSGFVITAGLLRELESTGRINLLGFYGRRAKRLLPAAGVVLVVTALMAWWLASRVHWRTMGGDILGSAAYVVNWVFSVRSVDYLAEDVEPSPVLHFWSLAVEEQFYFIWPLVLAALFALALRWTWRGSRRATLAIGTLGVMVLPSLLFAQWMSTARPEEAFFVTPTRLWELGIGCLVAIGASVWPRIPRPLAALLAWAGLIAIVYSAVTVDAGTPWPAPWALVPTLGTAAVIIGGVAARRYGVPSLLSTPLMVWIGALSYSLYLWHWPLLRFATWQWGQLSTWQGLLVVTASVLPAWLSYRLLERPIRESRILKRSPKAALTVGLNFTVIALVAGLMLTMAARPAGEAGQRSDLLVPGGLSAEQLLPTTPPAATGTPPAATEEPEPTEEPEEPEPTEEPTEPDDPPEPSGPQPPTLADTTGEPVFEVITPDPLLAVEDLPSTYDDDCQVDMRESQVTVCEGGDPDGDVVVALVGDSKIAQWVPALEAIADDNGWVLRSYVKSACTFTDAITSIEGEEYTSCWEWGQNLIEELTGSERPDVMITSGLRAEAIDADGDLNRQGLVDGFVDAWQPLIDQGVLVVAMGDNPNIADTDEPVYECVADHPDDYVEQCSWDWEQRGSSRAMQQAADLVDEAVFIDMDPWICPEGTCVPVYRNVLTYRQGSHLTATFTLFLAPALAQHLLPEVRDHLG